MHFFLLLQEYTSTAKFLFCVVFFYFVLYLCYIYRSSFNLALSLSRWLLSHRRLLITTQIPVNYQLPNELKCFYYLSRDIRSMCCAALGRAASTFDHLMNHCGFSAQRRSKSKGDKVMGLIISSCMNDTVWVLGQG